MPKWSFDLHPTPASRPKVSRYGTYYGKNYTKFRRMAEIEIPKVIKNHTPYSLDTALVVITTSYVNQPPTSERDWPRGDVDNYAKAILDACNGVVWEDDDSILLLVVSKAWSEHERVELDVRVTTPEFAAGLLARIAKAKVRT